MVFEELRLGISLDLEIAIRLDLELGLWVELRLGLRLASSLMKNKISTCVTSIIINRVRQERLGF